MSQSLVRQNSESAITKGVLIFESSIFRPHPDSGVGTDLNLAMSSIISPMTINYS